MHQLNSLYFTSRNLWAHLQCFERDRGVTWIQPKLLLSPNSGCQVPYPDLASRGGPLKPWVPAEWEGMPHRANICHSATCWALRNPVLSLKNQSKSSQVLKVQGLWSLLGKSPNCGVLEVLLFPHYLPSFILAPALLSRTLQCCTFPLCLEPTFWYTECVWRVEVEVKWVEGREEGKLFKGRSRTRTDLQCMLVILNKK